MRVWYGYGSEHSMNLVMIGHFKDIAGAKKAKQVIDQLTEQVDQDHESGLIQMGSRTDRYSNDMLDLLTKVNVHILGPSELEQFIYDVKIKIEGPKIVLTTEETDVSVFLKLLVDMGARVEVYSAHDYPDTDYGRGK